jgi:hypothetical protein
MVEKSRKPDSTTSSACCKTPRVNARKSSSTTAVHARIVMARRSCWRSGDGTTADLPGSSEAVASLPTRNDLALELPCV